MEEQTFKFRINGYSPESFPMERLGEYLVQVAKFLGNSAHVHLKSVEKGSVEVVSSVAALAVTRTEERFNQAFSEDAPKDIREAVEKLNKMLMDDNTSATFKASFTNNLLTFPGVKAPKPKRFGPVKERGSLVGRLTRLEGVDSSKHLTLVIDGKKVAHISAKLNIAQQLKDYLFEDVSIRLHGNGKWYREPDGQWTMESFVVDGFEELEDKHLSEIAKEFPDLDVGWAGNENPLAELRSERHGDDT